MDSLDAWEQIRIFGYVFIVTGFILLLLGIYYEAVGFGGSGSLNTHFNYLGKMTKYTGTACGTFGGTLSAVAGNLNSK